MAIALVSHVGTTGGTPTAAINTLGAFLIVIGIGGAAPVTAPVDNLGNSYVRLTNWVGNNGGGMTLFYRLTPLTSATHTFTGSAANSPALCAAAFSGVGAFNQQSGANDPGSGTAMQPGALTPPVNGALFVTGCGGSGVTGVATIAGGFTATDSFGTVAGTNYSMGLAYFVQPTAAALNPTWTVNASAASAVATFLAGVKLPPVAPVTIGGGIY